MTTISTTELLERLEAPDLTIVDVRPLAAYNGWRPQRRAPRRAHPGRGRVPERLAAQRRRARDRPAARHEADRPRPRDRHLRRRPRSRRVRGKVAPAGHRGRQGLPGGLWRLGGRRAPAGRAPARYESLVHIEWLRQVLKGERPEAAPAGKFLLFHVNFGVPEEYAEGHIPGALYLDTNWLEDPADWNRRSPEAIEAALRALGITSDTTVVVYGRDTEGDANEKWPGRRAGQIAATRALMILRYAGVDDVRLLDGGYDWWVRTGNPLETVAREPSPVTDFGVTVPAPARGHRRHRRGQGDHRRPATARRSSASAPGASTSAT